jgi:hypothetical protein
MKKLILLAAFVAGFVLMANAQVAKKSPDQRAAHETKALSKKLGLSQQQAQQVNAILVTQASRMDSLKSNPSPDKKEGHITERTIKLTSERNIMAVLNDAQKQQFKDWLQMRKEKHMAKRDTVGAKG